MRVGINGDVVNQQSIQFFSSRALRLVVCPRNKDQDISSQITPLGVDNPAVGT